MNISKKLKVSSASDDLTVVLLRGNGSPRSFRISLPALHRSLTAIGFLFAFAIVASLILLGFSILREVELPSAPPAPVAAPAPTDAPSSGGGLWDQLKGDSAPATSDSELQKEVAGLRQDIANLSARTNEAQALPTEGTSPLLQFFGPRSALVPEAQTFMRIKNPRVTREGKEFVVTFELHNVEPSQKQQRGYIVAIAKAPDLITTYPNGVLKPGENVLLDFSRGETFAVSRFREARASFASTPLEGKKVNFQILLFAHDGKVIGNLHVDGGSR